MMRCLSLSIVCLTFLFPYSVYGGYGDPVDGSPSQKERELHLLVNVARVAPQQFRETYIGNSSILLPENYPPVDPVYLHPDLLEVAHAHAQDMAENCGLSHNSCDGTLWSTRISSAYTASGWIAENVATGYSTALATVIQLLRDDHNGVPAADNSGGDGHRKNIMNSRYQDFGAGYAYSSSRPWYHFWVQDFGGGTAVAHAIAAGSHLLLTSGKITFMAVFSDPDGSAPQSAEVVVDGVTHTLSLDLGTAARGSYVLELADDDDCRDYYFRFVDSGGTTWRYPETSELSNNPSQSCTPHVELGDVVRVLQVLSRGLSDPADAAEIPDGNGDGRIDLIDAISMLRSMAGLE